MVKITELPLIDEEDIDGTEHVPVVKDGAMGRAPVAGLQTGVTAAQVRDTLGTTIEAAEDIEAGELLNLFDDAGDARVRLADASDPEKFCNAYATGAAALGEPCQIMCAGANKLVVPAQTGEVWLSAVTPGDFAFAPPAEGSGHMQQSVGTAIEGVGILFTAGDRYGPL